MFKWSRRQTTRPRPRGAHITTRRLHRQGAITLVRVRFRTGGRSGSPIPNLSLQLTEAASEPGLALLVPHAPYLPVPRARGPSQCGLARGIVELGVPDVDDEDDTHLCVCVCLCRGAFGRLLACTRAMPCARFSYPYGCPGGLIVTFDSRTRTAWLLFCQTS